MSESILFSLLGTRNMAKAYVSSPGKQREHLSNVKMGYKETTQVSRVNEEKTNK